MQYRKANKADIPQLLELENNSFDSNKLTERRFQYFLKLSNGELIVQLIDSKISGYGLILFHRGTALARLYSIAVSPNFRGMGLGKKLLLKLESIAKDKGCSYVRLEVKFSNHMAINLYEKNNYRRFAVKKAYYSDGKDAYCYEKKIRTLSSSPIQKIKVPYYQQTTEFTCGPACILMGMKALDRKSQMTREHEITIWREATTIFMTSGTGGCGPHGLALSAKRRGFEVELYLNTSSTFFIEGVRKDHKKEIIELVQKSFEKEIKKEKIKVYKNEYSWETIQDIFENGGIPIILISAYRLTENKAPHWIVLTGIESDFIYFHDPEVGTDQTSTDNTNIPVRKDEFEAMTRYGSKQLKSIVAIYP